MKQLEIKTQVEAELVEQWLWLGWEKEKGGMQVDLLAVWSTLMFSET